MQNFTFFTHQSLEDEVMKLRAFMRAVEKAAHEASPEFNTSLNTHFQNEMKEVIALQKRRADDAVPGFKTKNP